MSILTAIENGVLRIVINRPDKKNALTEAMYEGLNEAFDTAAAESSVRVILIAGEGDSFTSGNDLKDFLDHPPIGVEAPVFQFLRNIAHCPKPIVAAVRGNAIGIGTTMLLHCDVVYAGDDSRFQLPFVNLGLCPEAASSLLLPMVAGYQRAAEKLMFGETFTAEDAREMGFVNQILPPDEVIEHAKRRAEKLAALPAPSVRATKALLKGGSSDDLRKQTYARIKEEVTIFSALLDGPAAKEALTAFAEKRKPDFSSIE
ncbi:enoyl-CoA hydratase [soil metagenome]